jgi:hypothetical protein
MSDTDIPASVMPKTKFISERLRGTRAAAVLSEMCIKAERDASYDAVLRPWLLNQTSTLGLREAAEPFGNYSSDLAFANVVDALDSASAAFRAAKIDPSGWPK